MDAAPTGEQPSDPVGNPPADRTVDPPADRTVDPPADRTVDPPADPVADLRAATCSHGAPSARNLLVTVFGDALVPHGVAAEVSVRSLAELLAGFGVNERLVRTSLTRLVNDGLLIARTEGRRSFYRVAPAAHELFAQADRRIYDDGRADWDGSWTVVVIDGSEADAATRARLRQELAWVGLGVVAPNVMASPVVPAADAAAAVVRVGGLANVLVTRSQVIEVAGTSGADELARRCAPLGDVTEAYDAFTGRFAGFDPGVAAALAPAEAFKLRTLLVAAFRRIVLADPGLPAELLPDPWPGERARAVAAGLYRAVAGSSERFLADRADPPLGRLDRDLGTRFTQ